MHSLLLGTVSCLGTPSPGRPPPQPSFLLARCLAEPAILSTLPGLPISLFLLCNGAVWTRLRGGSSGLRWVSAGCRPSFPRALLPLFPSLRVSVRRYQGRRRWGCQNLNSTGTGHATRSRFRPSSTLPKVTALLSTSSVLLREKVTFGPFG